MKKELKGFCCGVITATMLAGVTFAAGQWKTIDVLENDITVIVDGEKVSESNFVYNDRTYLPLRAVAEAVNKPVEYDESTNTAYIGVKPNEEIEINPSAITYYQDVEWCPNFGALTNLECNSIGYPSEYDGLYIYTYNQSEKTNTYISAYIEILESLSFVHRQTTDDNTMFYAKGPYTIAIKETSNRATIAAGIMLIESGGGDDIGVYVYEDIDKNQYVSVSGIESVNALYGLFTSILINKNGQWVFSEYAGKKGFVEVATGTPICDYSNNYYIPMPEYTAKIKPILSKYASKYKSILP